MEGKEQEGFAFPLSQISVSSSSPSTSSSTSTSSSSATEDREEQRNKIINSKIFIDDNVLTSSAIKLKITNKQQLQAKVPSILAVFAGTPYVEFLSTVLPIVSAVGNPTPEQIDLVKSLKLIKDYILYHIIQPGMF